MRNAFDEMREVRDLLMGQKMESIMRGEPEVYDHWHLELTINCGLSKRIMMPNRTYESDTVLLALCQVQPSVQI